MDERSRRQKRAALSEAVGAYAAEVAGSRDDLDPQLEAAALEHWHAALAPAGRE